MQKVKNIIFDFGGVLLSLDMERTRVALQQLVGDFYSHSTADNSYPALFQQYELGNCSEAYFFAALQQACNYRHSTAELKAAWNAMLLDFPKAHLTMLERLAIDYRLFLLSNTNTTHLRAVLADLAAVHGVVDFNRYFEKTYYSHLIHLRKPEPDIFTFVLQDAHLVASETLFIDDNPANIRTAQVLGFQTILHNDGRSIVDVLKDF